MCYDIKASLESQLNRARRKNDTAAIQEITEKLAPLTDLPIYHTTGFNHPSLLIYTNESPFYPEVAVWGLVPHWVRETDQLKKIWNNTLNARSETIFEKPSFRESAKHKRCIVYVDGFYEHHHFQGKTYPFYIFSKKKFPLALAGLWSEWVNRETGEVLSSFSIVTTKGNRMMTKIHNNPKLNEARMPLLLAEELEDQWLYDTHSEDAILALTESIIQSSEEVLDAYTVARLRGASYLGNVEEVSDPVHYSELVM